MRSYSASAEKSFTEQRTWLMESDLLTAIVRHGADGAEEQLVLEPDLLRLAVVLEVHVDRHREAAVARLRHLVRRFLDYCNAQRRLSVVNTNKKPTSYR